MLDMAKEQGVGVMAATPHFYAWQTTLDSFLKKRDMANDMIQDAAAKRGIRVLPGAEVAFFPGIGRADGIECLTIGGTSLLLLEMPFRAWDSSDLQEIERLLARGLTPVLAHIERFYAYQKNRRMLDAVYSLPVLVQVNAESLLNWRTKHLAFDLFRKGNADLLGSDCHNTTSRPPNLAGGRRAMEKRLGTQYLLQMDRLGEEALGR